MAEGGCLCGEVRFRAEGEPARVALCHCLDCRRESGSAFVFFGVWPREAVTISGAFASHEGRSFCSTCGARLFCLRETETEIRMGALDEAPTGFAPAYENWVKRREAWLKPLAGREQFPEDPPQTG